MNEVMLTVNGDIIQLNSDIIERMLTEEMQKIHDEEIQKETEEIVKETGVFPDLRGEEWKSKPSLEMRALIRVLAEILVNN